MAKPQWAMRYFRIEERFLTYAVDEHKKSKRGRGRPLAPAGLHAPRRPLTALCRPSPAQRAGQGRGAAGGGAVRGARPRLCLFG